MEKSNIPDILLRPYIPKEHEETLYTQWKEAGLFNPDICIEKGYTKADATPYSIILPPPNVTGVLHMGHALMLAIQDALIRFRRMQGYRTLWIPGTDHAAIATQSKVEKEISKQEGKTRYDLGREALVQRIEAFAQESHDTIVTQIARMGASVDWSREAFTLDEQRTHAVRTMFKKMYDDGLIYRKERIVNWDPKGQTTIADDEIVHEERAAVLYTFTYGRDIPIPIATTRPETKVGDVAIAVHPDDPRYKHYIGTTYTTTFCGVPLTLTVIGDTTVDPTFGTGALGVTPAHSMTDWEIGERHQLPIIKVIDERARMCIGDDRLHGKKTTEAREVIVAWLKEEGLLQKEEPITQNVSTAERTGGIIEPLPKLQWFIDVNKPFLLAHSQLQGIPSGSVTTLKAIMRTVVAEKQITLIPDYFEKTYFHWIDGLRDWCISRQIWYGHRIPVWYKGDAIYCGTEAPQEDGWVQDEDTLDTWFSSGLWTFSTLGWPEQTPDLATYHPTHVLETGYEILFFWVARMVLMTGYGLGTIPFETVYLHGTVRDGKGRKMSKSLGNGIDPIDIAETYGADAGRMALLVGTAPGTDSKIDENKIKGYKHFANKLWNIARFILSTTHDTHEITHPDDKVLVDELQMLAHAVTHDIELYKLHLASEKLYHYAWHRLADEILEESKSLLQDETRIASRSATLRSLFRTTITLLHPFMPFVTEAVWAHIKKEDDRLLIVTPWPTRSS